MAAEAASVGSGGDSQSAPPVAAAAPVEATPPTPPFVDLTGVFELDKEKSESIEPFLKEVGVPWIARKAVVSMSATLTIEHTPERIKITNANMLRKTENDLAVGGQSEFTAGDGSKLSMLTEPAADGHLVCTAPMPKGDKRRTVTTYTLVPGSPDEVHVCIQVLSGDGKPRVQVTRVFGRKTDP